MSPKENNMDSANLYYKEGSSDKVYHCSVEKDGSGYVVNFAFGRRGSALRTGSKTSSPVSLESARSIFEKLIREKMAKGYRPMDGAEGSTIPVVKDDLPNTPVPIQCVLLNPIEEDEAKRLLGDDNWGCQPKFDGVRFMLRKSGDKITALNRKGKQVSVPNSLASAVAKKSCDFFLDGELIGETYYAFDILEFDGDCLRSSHLCKRTQLLQNAVKDVEGVVLVNVSTGKQKASLYEKLLKEDKEGIVFKRLDAHYNVGRPASGGSYLKHKFYATCSCFVTEVNQKRSVAVGLLDGRKVVPVGNVTISSNFKVPNVGDIIEVRYLYAYKGGSLYQPTYLGVRSDIDRQECVLSQLKYKSGEDDES